MLIEGGELSSEELEMINVLILVLMEYAHWDCVGFHRVN